MLSEEIEINKWVDKFFIKYDVQYSQHSGLETLTHCVYKTNTNK